MSLCVRELTASGRGGVGVIELCGTGALQKVAELSGGKLPAIGSFRLLRLSWQGEPLDEALCYAAGPEALELHLHGSPAVLRRLISALEAEPAPPGESLEERAEALLAAAPSEAAARMLLDQARGALRRELERLDLGEEAALRQRVEELVERARVAAALLWPPRVVLGGPVNAGKSTLFNALLGSERVVVCEEAGTTRDAIREPAFLGPWRVELDDVAGERLDEAAPRPELEPVEEGAVQIGRSLARRADLLLWLQPAPEPARHAPVGEAGARCRGLVSRADLLAAGEGRHWPHAVSALTDPLGARRTVGALFREALSLPERPWEAGRGVPFEPGLASRIAAWPGMSLEERLRDRLSLLSR